jgi:hypothetical protein
LGTRRVMARILSEQSESSFSPSHAFCGCTTFWRDTASAEQGQRRIGGDEDGRRGQNLLLADLIAQKTVGIVQHRLRDARTPIVIVRVSKASRKNKFTVEA